MSRRMLASVLAVGAVVLTPFLCPAAGTVEPVEKVAVVDGHVVHDLGDLWNHVTNWGLIGSRPGVPTTFGDSPSAYWHGTHHLWGAGVWVGGVVLGEQLVTTGGGPLELRPSDAPGDTIFPAFTGMAGGTRYPRPGADDDGDGAEDEDPLNGLDDDGDGLTDEDFAAIGDQHFRCVMADTGQAIVDALPDHTPLRVEITQQSFQWDDPLMADVIGYDFAVRNIGVVTIDDVHCGMFSDFDIGSAEGGAEDDHAGSFRGMVETSTGAFRPVTVAWMRDGAATPVGGWIGWVMCGMHTDAAAGGPADPLGVQTFQRFSGQAPFIQGGDPTNDSERYTLLSATLDHWDTDTIHEADHRVLMSTEAVPALAPGETLVFRTALVVGETQESMLAAAAEAVLTAEGAWFDRDEDPSNGEEWHVPWLRPQEIPVPAVAGRLQALPDGAGVNLGLELEHHAGVVADLVRRTGPGVPGRRWSDVGALPGGALRDDDPVGWPRTYALVAKAAGGEIELDSVTLPGAVGSLSLTASPNPFNPRVELDYRLPVAGVAQVEVLDLRGRVVRTLVDARLPAGPGTVVWDGRDRQGHDLASGVYLVRVRTREGSVGRRVTLLR